MQGEMLPPKRPSQPDPNNDSHICVSLLRTGHHEKYISLQVTRLDGDPARPQRFYFSFRPDEVEPFVNALINGLMALPDLIARNETAYREKI